MKPPIKYAGGKYLLAPTIAELMPSTIGNYIEPFLGAGGAFLGLKERGKIQTAFLSDQCEDLILMWRSIQLYALSLSVNINSLQPFEGWNEKAYYELRGMDREPDWQKVDPLVKAARFVVMNRLAYNGLCRYNQSGQFNVPWGKYKPESWNIPTAKQLLDLSAEIKYNTSIKCLQFTQAISKAKEGDFIYCDPPYTKVKKTDFTGYSGAWGEGHQKRLHRYLMMADKRGVKFVLSGNNEPSIRELYNRQHFGQLEIVEIDVRRSIAANGDRTKAKELLIRNYTC